ncbi:hypothetical protein BpHYR1_024804 [Brachionus plicatilis]|uniref:Uncharacterized protein n=1 Tax=Brachionus plicatilis TaxID=10195 RepID=A0A3M7RYR9_BRAPC|nr:hypothetical protein BpHYR1_024804 [Brachionus plicatilis]
MLLNHTNNHTLQHLPPTLRRRRSRTRLEADCLLSVPGWVALLFSVCGCACRALCSCKGTCRVCRNDRTPLLPWRCSFFFTCGYSAFFLCSTGCRNRIRRRESCLSRNRVARRRYAKACVNTVICRVFKPLPFESGSIAGDCCAIFISGRNHRSSDGYDCKLEARETRHRLDCLDCPFLAQKDALADF